MLLFQINREVPVVCFIQPTTWLFRPRFSSIDHLQERKSGWQLHFLYCALLWRKMQNRKRPKYQTHRTRTTPGQFIRETHHQRAEIFIRCTGGWRSCANDFKIAQSDTAVIVVAEHPLSGDAVDCHWAPLIRTSHQAPVPGRAILSQGSHSFT